MEKIAIGVDVGGSHIKSAAVNLTKQTVIKESMAESDLDNQAPAGEILTIWADTLKKSIEYVGNDNLAGIGFGMPGPFDYEKGIALFKGVLKYDNLYGINVSEELRKKLELPAGFPLYYMNDATAFAVGEAWLGQGAPYSRALAVTLGSGLGSAFIADGIPVVTGDLVPDIGAVWHLPFKEGIVNDYFCTHWFIAEYEKRTGKVLPGVKELADIYEEDQVARDLFHEYGQGLGSVLAPWLDRFGAEIFIMGGNITGAYPLFKDPLQQALEEGNAGVKVGISQLKEDVALLGSARLIDEDYFGRVGPVLKFMK